MHIIRNDLLEPDIPPNVPMIPPDTRWPRPLYCGKTCLTVFLTAPYLRYSYDIAVQTYHGRGRRVFSIPSKCFVCKESLPVRELGGYRIKDAVATHQKCFCSLPEHQAGFFKIYGAQTECSICYGDFTDEDRQKISLLSKCGHISHNDCLKEWFKESRTCPNCRLPA